MRQHSGFAIAIASGLLVGVTLTVAAQEEVGTVDPCSTPATPVTGDIIWGHERPGTQVHVDELGRHVRDFVYDSKLEASDDRLDGSTTATLTWDFFRAQPEGRRAGVNGGEFAIENDAGAWLGTWTGIGTALDSWRALVELTGSGAYDGLSATLFTHSGETGPVVGTVYPTDLSACVFPPAA